MEWADPGAGGFRRTAKPFGSQGILYGDKVINTVNGRRRDVYPKDGLGYVANGEIGMVVGQYKGKNSKLKGLPWKLEVEYGTQPGFKYGYYPSDFSQERDARVELAYALTVHKAQGSEFGISFVIIPNPCLLLSRELLYTALTRQQNKVIVFHQGDLRELRRYGQASRSELSARLTTLLGPSIPVEVAGRFLGDRLIHRTIRGELVRSKSEVIIANLLHNWGVEYEYERELTAPDGSRRYPDFTVEDAEGGRVIYIEHLGMLDNPRYRIRWERKLQWYRDQGILPIDETPHHDRLLVTTKDDPRGGIDSLAVSETLRGLLG